MIDKYLFLNALSVLTPEKERELLEKKEQPEAMEELTKHNLRLVIFIAKKYQNTNVDIDELVSIGTIGLIKGIQNYKLEKNIKLVTYASKCIVNEILMYFRESKKYSKEKYLSEVISVDQNGNELKMEDIIFDKRETSDTEDLEMLEILSNTLTIALNKLEFREKLILLLNLAGKTQREICKQFDLSQSYVSRIQNKIKAKIQHFAKKSIHEEPYCEFIFEFTENRYEFGVSLKAYHDLESKILNFEKNLKGVFKEKYNTVSKNKKNGYLFFEFFKEEESFLFICEILKCLDTPKTIKG